MEKKNETIKTQTQFRQAFWVQPDVSFLLSSGIGKKPNKNNNKKKSTTIIIAKWKRFDKVYSVQMYWTISASILRMTNV